MASETSRFSVKRISIFLIIGAVLAGGIYYSGIYFSKRDPEPEPPKLKIGGTSVAYVIMENFWKKAYFEAKKVKLDYESTGSTKGLTNLIDKKYAIGFTHKPLDEDQMKKAGGAIVHVPIVLCAVVPIYNSKELAGKYKDSMAGQKQIQFLAAQTVTSLAQTNLTAAMTQLVTLKRLQTAYDRDIPPLNFTGEVLGEIFLGNIKKWNEEPLKKLNPEVDLPDMAFVVVHRKDPSGTTYIFSDYLQQASPNWKKKFNEASSEIKWPAGNTFVGKERSESLALHVEMTEGAIGYVDLLHAWNHNLPYGAVKNNYTSKDVFVHVKAENMTAALKARVAKKIPDDLTYSLTNQDGEDSYPICGTIWAVCYQNQPEGQQKMVVDCLQWLTHEGQAFAAKTSYAPLSEEMVKRAEEKIKTIAVGK